METTTLGYISGLYMDNGKEHGNYYNGLYIRVIYGHWKRKWKLLYLLTVSVLTHLLPERCKAHSWPSLRASDECLWRFG